MTSPVTRLSHVALRRPDVERKRTYYTEMPMDITGTDRGSIAS